MNAATTSIRVGQHWRQCLLAMLMFTALSVLGTTSTAFAQDPPDQDPPPAEDTGEEPAQDDDNQPAEEGDSKEAQDKGAEEGDADSEEPSGQDPTEEDPPEDDPAGDDPADDDLESEEPKSDNGLTPEEKVRFDELRAKSYAKLTAEEREEYLVLLRKFGESKTKGIRKQPRTRDPKVTKPKVKSRMPRVPKREDFRRTDDPEVTEDEEPIIPAEVPEDNFLKPYNERIYQFALRERPYNELVEMFARQASLPLIGSPVELLDDSEPTGRISYVITHPISFYSALEKINDLLYKEINPKLYLYLNEDPDDRSETQLELYAVKELRKQLPMDRVFTSMESVTAADLRDSEILRVFFAPETSSDIRVFNELVLQLLDDATLAAVDPKSGQVDFYGRVDMLRKMLHYMDKFADIYGAGNIQRLPVKHLEPSVALQMLNMLVENLRGESAEKPSRSSSRSKRDDVLTAESEKVFVLADDAHKCLWVSGLPYKVSEVEDALKSIDIPLEETELGSMPVVVRLQYAKAADAARILDSIFKKAPLAEGKKAAKARVRSMSIGGEDKLVITPDKRSNSLIMQGPEALIERAKALLEMFVDVPVQDHHSFRLVELQHRDPAEMAKIVKSVIGKKAPKGELPFNVHESASALIISGEPADMDKAEQLISQLDQPDVDKDTMHSAKLENAQPSMVVLILEMMDSPDKASSSSKKKSRRARSSGGRFFADDALGVIYYVGTDREWEQNILPIIQQVDKDATDVPTSGEFVKLQYADPTDVMKSLQGLQDPKSKTEGPRFAATPLGLIIGGDVSPGELKAIKDTISMLDVNPDVAMQRKQRTFPLKYADSSMVEKAIRSLYETTRSGRGKKGSAAAQREDMRIATTTTGIIIKCSEERMVEIAALIEGLDQKGVTIDSVLLQRFTLVHAPAAEVSVVLEPILQTKLSELQAKQSAEQRKGQPKGKSKISVEPYSRSNSIIISAPQAILDYADEVIAQLDVAQDAEQQFTAYYQCVNANALELASLLSSMFGGGGPAGVSGGQGQDAKKRRERLRKALQSRSGGGDVVVHAVPGDRAISITTRTKEQLDQVLDRAKELDDISISDDPLIRRFPLQFADVYELADDIIEMFGEQAKGGRKAAKSSEEDDWFSMWEVDTGPRVSKDIRIKPLEESRMLVITAPPAKMLAIEQYIKEVEDINRWVAEEGGPELASLPYEFYTPRHLGAAETMEIADNFIYQLYGTGAPVEIGYIDKDTLVLKGNPKYFGDIKKLIENFVDTEDRVHRVGNVVSITKLPSNIPPEVLMSMIRSYLPDLEIDMQDMSALRDQVGGEFIKEIK